MSNIIDATDVRGGSVLEFTRRGGSSAFYFYAGIPAAIASANPRSGGSEISAAQASLLKAESAAQTVEEVGEAAEFILPFLL